MLPASPGLPRKRLARAIIVGKRPLHGIKTFVIAPMLQQEAAAVFVRVPLQ